MKIDLDSMSDKELAELRTQVDKAIASLGARRRAEARRAVEEAASKHGFSLSELVGNKAEKIKSVAKFRNPEDPSQTWSGRGRQPAWYKEGIAAGKSPSDFAI